MLVPRRSLAPLLVMLGALLAVHGCSETPQTEGGAKCAYRQAAECTGENGCAGTMVCRDDLAGFGDCHCGDAGASDAGPSDGGADE